MLEVVQHRYLVPRRPYPFAPCHAGHIKEKQVARTRYLRTLHIKNIAVYANISSTPITAPRFAYPTGRHNKRTIDFDVYGCCFATGSK